MPRKNRSIALALGLALLVCLAGQAGAAMPIAGPRGDNDTTAGNVLSAAWAWFTSHWANVGDVVASPARQAPAAVEKVGACSDPNNGNCHGISHVRGRGERM